MIRMKKIVFCFCLIFSVTGSADFIRSDSALLSDNMPDQETTDPYWNLAWHGRVAGYGDPDSQFFVAQVYEQGRLVPQDMPKALDFYKRAANQGHLESCMRLAHLLPDEAENWYLIAARQNDPQAQIKLSRLYEEKGQIDEAVLWLEKALRYMFPNATDLTTVSPDLIRLRSKL